LQPFSLSTDRAEQQKDTQQPEEKPIARKKDGTENVLIFL
jgi:hypothetical protein